MAKFPGFLGPAYESRAGLADLQRLINLFLEKDESGNEENAWILYSTPGLSPFSNLPTQPVRGIWVGEGRLFAVSGNTFYEVFSNGTYTSRGTVANDSKPAYIYPNGNQVMVVSGGQCYVDNGSGLVQPIYTSAQGYVNVTGNVDVQLYYGDTFDATMVGNQITINSVAYTVAALVDAYHLTLVAPGLDNGSTPVNGLAYYIPNAGFVNVQGTEIRLVSGDPFTPGMVGHFINLGGLNYTVTTWVNDSLIYVSVAPSLGARPSTGYPYTAAISVTASCGFVLDGYFGVVTPNTKQVNISEQWNGLRWDPSKYQIKEGYPDNIQATFTDHEEVWVCGSQDCEVWRNVGNADFPFQRDPGAFIHKGLGAAASVSRLSTGPGFLSSNEQGGPVAFRMQGYQPERISTHALEYRWGKYTTWSDAESYTYVEEGHEFWVIGFPTAGETWVFDAANGTWHQRAYGAGLARHRARNHAFAFGAHIVGDYQTGQLYKMSAEYPDDNGTTIRRIRRAPHIRQPLEQGRGAHASFKVVMTYNAGDTVTLRWSNDYGENWTDTRTPDSLLIADGTATRVLGYRWNRLGSFFDRVYEFEVQSAAKVAIAQVDVE